MKRKWREKEERARNLSWIKEGLYMTFYLKTAQYLTLTSRRGFLITSHIIRGYIGEHEEEYMQNRRNFGVCTSLKFYSKNHLLSLDITRSILIFAGSMQLPCDEEKLAVNQVCGHSMIPAGCRLFIWIHITDSLFSCRTMSNCLINWGSHLIRGKKFFHLS